MVEPFKPSQTPTESSFKAGLGSTMVKASQKESPEDKDIKTALAQQDFEKAIQTFQPLIALLPALEGRKWTVQISLKPTKYTLSYPSFEYEAAVLYEPNLSEDT